MCINPQFPADLVAFNEKILNGKLYFLGSENKTSRGKILQYIYFKIFVLPSGEKYHRAYFLKFLLIL